MLSQHARSTPDGVGQHASVRLAQREWAEHDASSVGKRSVADDGIPEGESESSILGAALPVGIALPVGMLDGTPDEFSAGMNVGELVGISVVTVASDGEVEDISVIFAPEGGDEVIDVGSSVAIWSEGEDEGASVTTITVVGNSVGADVSAGVGSSDGISETAVSTAEGIGVEGEEVGASVVALLTGDKEGKSEGNNEGDNEGVSVSCPWPRCARSPKTKPTYISFEIIVASIGLDCRWYEKSRR